MSLPYKFSPQSSDGNSTQNVRRVLSSGSSESERIAFQSDAHYVTPLILKVDGLIKIYGTRRVVDGVNFHVNKGEVVGLLGPNGAGKTTSFRMTLGMINTNGGVVFLNGKDVTNWPMYRRAKEGGMGYLPQDKSVFSNLTVQDNLLGIMELLGIDKRTRLQRCDELLEKFKLTHLRKNYAGSGGSGGLSGGERRRLEIARALVSDPKIILLDEPFAAIDPIQVSSIQEIVRQLAEEGIAILITDHSVRRMLQTSHRCYVIDGGKVLCHGTPDEVVSNPEAKRVYFGDEADDLTQSGRTASYQVTTPAKRHHDSVPTHSREPQRDDDEYEEDDEYDSVEIEMPLPKPPHVSRPERPIIGSRPIKPPSDV